jgi:hypothetical protein
VFCWSEGGKAEAVGTLSVLGGFVFFIMTWVHSVSLHVCFVFFIITFGVCVSVCVFVFEKGTKWQQKAHTKHNKKTSI